MAKQSLTNRLVGATIKPSASLYESSDRMGEPLIASRLWGLKPTAAANYMATIEAAWLDDENNIVILMRGPNGDTRRTYFHDGLYDIERVGDK